VLVADDDAPSQIVARIMLERRGYAVSVVGDGREAVAALETERFDIVLMDVMMPDMDGYEATKSIRDREKLTGRHIPIVAMTAQARAGDQQRCLAAGMDGFVSKPIRMGELLATIETLLKKGSDAVGTVSFR